MARRAPRLRRIARDTAGVTGVLLSAAVSIAPGAHAPARGPYLRGLVWRRAR
jgi:hypothetical protein